MNIEVMSLSSRQSLINLYKEMKSTVCEGYSCEFCNICPLGEFFDEKENEVGCNEYQRQITDYNNAFNQDNYKEKLRTRL